MTDLKQVKKNILRRILLKMMKKMKQPSKEAHKSKAKVDHSNSYLLCLICKEQDISIHVANLFSGFFRVAETLLVHISFQCFQEVCLFIPAPRIQVLSSLARGSSRTCSGDSEGPQLASWQLQPGLGSVPLPHHMLSFF